MSKSVKGRNVKFTVAFGAAVLFSLPNVLRPAQVDVHDAKLESALRQAVGNAPHNFQANFDLGEFYLQAGQLTRAVPFMAEAHRLDAAHYVTAYDLALAYFDLHEYQKGDGVIDSMLAKRNTAELHNLRADIKEGEGDYVAAANEFQIAAHMEPSEKNILDWGSEFLTHKNQEAAIPVFREGLRLFPSSAKLHIGLGIAEYLAENFDAAAKDFCNASDLSRLSPEPYLLLGTLHSVHAGQTAEVEKRLRSFAEANPHNVRALFNYGTMLAERDRDNADGLNRAELLLRAAITADPKFEEAYLQLGILQLRRRDYGAAVRYLQQAIQINPSSALSYFQLGTALRDLGQSREAEPYFQKFRELHTKKKAADEKQRSELSRFVISMKEVQ